METVTAKTKRCLNFVEASGATCHKTQSFAFEKRLKSNVIISRTIVWDSFKTPVKRFLRLSVHFYSFTCIIHDHTYLGVTNLKKF